MLNVKTGAKDGNSTADSAHHHMQRRLSDAPQVCTTAPARPPARYSAI